MGLVQRLNLINKNLLKTLEQILKEFEGIFSHTRRFESTVKNKLKETCVPQAAAPRKMFFALHNKVKEELINMVDAGMIFKVEKTTELVSNMVLVQSKKNAENLP